MLIESPIPFPLNTLLHVYILETPSKNQEVAQSITIDFPDGTGFSISLRNTSKWQRIALPVQCQKPDDKVTITFIPSGNHSTFGYGIFCKDLKPRAHAVRVMQKPKNTISFGETFVLSREMKNAIDLLK